MPNLKYYIDINKVDSNGLVPIKANIAVESKNNWKIVGKVKPPGDEKPKAGEWDQDLQRIVLPRPDHKKYAEYEKINRFLEEFKERFNKIDRDCTESKIRVTREIVQKYYNGQKIEIVPVIKDFWEAYDAYLKAGELERAPNTIRNRLTIKKKIKEFEKDTGRKITFESVNLVFFDDLKEWVLETKEYDYNYLPPIVSKFKAFMKWSLDREYHSNVTFMRFSAPEKEGSIIHLTYDELKLLVNFNFDNPKHQRTRDFFCFGCLTGLRYCDLQRLTKDNIVNGSIKITTQKVNKAVTIPIIDDLKTIIDKYPEPHKLLPKFANSNLNEYVKECCKIAEIKTLTEWKTFKKNITITEFKPKHELITTHTARKTFINLSYSADTPIETIKAITGITREKTLKRYLEVSEDSITKSLNRTFKGISKQDENLKAEHAAEQIQA